MSDGTLADELMRLFVHQSNGHIKVNKITTSHRKKGEWSSVQETLTPEKVQQHLDGEITIGSYCPNIDSNSKILMFDIDDHKKETDKYTSEEIPEIIKIITSGLIRHRLHPFLEKSGMNNGHHIWTSIEPTPAKEVSAFGHRLLDELNLSGYGIEVFPKVESITKRRPYGIGYKLPLGKHRTTEIVGELLFKSYEKKSDFKYRGKETLSYLQKVKPDILFIDIEDNDDDDDEDVEFDDEESFSPLAIVGEEEIDSVDKTDETDEVDDEIKHLLRKLVRAKPCTRSTYIKNVQLNSEYGHMARLIIMREFILIKLGRDNVHTFFKSQNDYSKAIVDKKFDEEVRKLEKEREKYDKKELAKEIKAEAEGRVYVKDDRNYRPFTKGREMKKIFKHIKELASTCEACDTAYVAKSKANAGDELNYEKDVFLPLFIDKWKAIRKHGIKSKGGEKYILISREDLLEYANISETTYSGHILMLKTSGLIEMNKNLSEYHRIDYYPNESKTTQVIKFNINEIKRKLKGVKRIKR